MTVRKLVKVLLAGTSPTYPVVEDALSALRCVDVTSVEKGQRHFLVEGWMPQAWFDDLRYILEEATHGRVALEVDETVEPAVTGSPVVLENPRWVRPFQPLVEMFSLPGQAGVDPTFFTFVTLPLFFGFVIGDFGYGIVFVIIGLLLPRYYRTPLAELASSFLLFGGLWSIVFGTVGFAEFFAFHAEWGPLQYHFLDRLEDVTQLLLVSLVIGLAHLNLGLALGFIYERRRVGLRLASMKKLSWYVLEAGLLLMVPSVLGLLVFPLWIPGLALVALAVALISFGGGMMDLVGVPAFVGNILSYLRLGILGVATSVLGVVINEIVLKDLLPLGPVGWAMGVVALVTGHAVAMALAIITVGIHSLRLHYVEFYTKFYRMEEVGAYRDFRPTGKLPEPGGG